MNTPSRSRITRSTPPASRPPVLPPLGNNEGSGNEASECHDSDEGRSADVDAFVDDFLASLPTHADGGEGGLLDQFDLADDSDQSPALNRNLFEEFNPDERDKNEKPKGSRSQVVRCRECDIHLCIPCFEIFHTKQNLRPMIPTILRIQS